jgi:hypothetical protein
VPRRQVPLGLARAVATIVDVATYRGLISGEKEPPINNEKLDVMTRSILFSSAKAERVLGYAPRVSYVEGISATLGGSSS